MIAFAQFQLNSSTYILIFTLEEGVGGSDFFTGVHPSFMCHMYKYKYIYMYIYIHTHRVVS